MQITPFTASLEKIETVNGTNLYTQPTHKTIIYILGHFGILIEKQTRDRKYSNILINQPKQ